MYFKLFSLFIHFLKGIFTNISLLDLLQGYYLLYHLYVNKKVVLRKNLFTLNKRILLYMIIYKICVVG